MKKTALITGILGQDGPYLAKFLLEKDYKVYGMIRHYSKPNFENTNYLGVTDKIEFVTGDMADEGSLYNLIKRISPDEGYNLAAQSFIGAALDQPKLTTEVNALGVLYLLEAIRLFSPKTKFYQASTSELFGNSNESGSQKETTPHAPCSAYAIAKLYAYWTTINYRNSYQMFCVNGVLFNHESPIRGIEFVTRKISDGVARIKLGLAKEIRLGNLDAKRDWGFAGDFVEAMWLMLQKQKPDDYLVATGKSHSIREFLQAAFNHVGIKNWEKYIVIDPEFKRPTDVKVLNGIADKARKELGWKPKVNFEQLVKMMVDADIKRLKNQKKL